MGLPQTTRALFFATIFLLLFGSANNVFALSFTRDLSHGSTGTDVLALQRFLNKDSRTQLADTGAGSPGNETTYYGSLTAGAVVRYQELHAKEVLHPLGLSEGTGYFGPSTRRELGAVAGDVPAEKKTTRTPLKSGIETTVSTNEGTDDASDTPTIKRISPAQGPSGTELTIIGTGFTETGNVVDAGYALLEDVPSQNGRITIMILDPFPEALVLPPHLIDNIGDFEYEISVKNENGSSNSVVFTLVNSRIKEYSRTQQ